MILPQSKNSQTSSLWDAFAYTLAILYYENFKNAYRSEQGYIKKDVLIKDILFYLNNNYREKITLEQLSKNFVPASVIFAMNLPKSIVFPQLTMLFNGV